jgi:recombinational DNA repair ATPase RecF
MDTLKIKNVEIEGFANISHIIMRELGDFVVLEGKNGAGKTEILTAIIAALEGKTSLPDRPLDTFIKDGYESGVIKLDLSDGTTVKYQIKVTIKPDDFVVDVREVMDDGKRKQVPGGAMTFLKSIINAISFRPQEWRKRTDKQILEDVFKFFPHLKEKLSENDAEVEKLKRQRSGELSKCDALRLDISRLSFSPGLPEQEVSAADLLEKLNAAKAHNAELDGLNESIDEIKKDCGRLVEEKRSIERDIARTEEMIAQLQEQISEKKKSVSSIEEEVAAKDRFALQVSERIAGFILDPVEQIETQLSQLNQTNEKVRANIKLRKKNEELQISEDSAKSLYKKMTDVKNDRSRIMSEAHVPMDGIVIGDGCLMCSNSSMEMVPITALSDGEFWGVSVGLVAAFNPRVGVIIVDDYWALDEDNYKSLCEAAKKHGMQVWIHKTLRSEIDSGAGFLIRGGEIVATPRG